MKAEIYNSIKMLLELKFNQIGDKLFALIKKITEIKKLKEIQHAIFSINDVGEMTSFIKKRV